MEIGGGGVSGCQLYSFRLVHVQWEQQWQLHDGWSSPRCEGRVRQDLVVWRETGIMNHNSG